MDVSAFDAQKFLEQQMDAPLERRPPLPVQNPERSDGFYIATIDKCEYRVWESKKPDAKLKNGVSLDVVMKLQVPAGLQASLGLGPELTLTDSVFVDINEAGNLDGSKGKNNGIRVYREALDMNKPGDSWSPAKMVGRPLLVKLSHDIYMGNPMEKVDRVLKI